MNLSDKILKENSRKNWEEVGNHIVRNPEKFDELIQLVIHGKGRLARLASQVMTNLADDHPEFFSENYLTALVDLLVSVKDFSIIRNTVRIFQFITVPEEKEGLLFELGLKFIRQPDSPIAVKAFSMTALRKICEKYPELAGELIPLIEILIEEKVSPGISNRGKKELDELKKILVSKN